MKGNVLNQDPGQNGVNALAVVVVDLERKQENVSIKVEKSEKQLLYPRSQGPELYSCQNASFFCTLMRFYYFILSMNRHKN